MSFQEIRFDLKSKLYFLTNKNDNYSLDLLYYYRY